MTEKTITSDAYIWPKTTGSTLICEGQIATNIIDEFGINVKIRVVSKDSFNNYGDATESYTDSFTVAYMHTWTTSDDEVKEGIYKNGQIMFMFKNTDDAKIKTGNRLFYGNEWYEFEEVTKQIMSGTIYFINATVKKRV